MSDAVDRLLPPPPIPGGQRLVHLSTPRMLAQEAQEQRVVFDDVGEYEKGCHCAYRVIAPARATLVITTRDQRWYMSMLVGTDGEPVSVGTFDAVLEWLLRGQSPRHRHFVAAHANRCVRPRGPEART